MPRELDPEDPPEAAENGLLPPRERGRVGGRPSLRGRCRLQCRPGAAAAKQWRRRRNRRGDDDGRGEPRVRGGGANPSQAGRHGARQFPPARRRDLPRVAPGPRAHLVCAHLRKQRVSPLGGIKVSRDLSELNDVAQTLLGGDNAADSGVGGAAAAVGGSGFSASSSPSPLSSPSSPSSSSASAANRQQGMARGLLSAFAGLRETSVVLIASPEQLPALVRDLCATRDEGGRGGGGAAASGVSDLASSGNSGGRGSGGAAGAGGGGGASTWKAAGAAISVIPHAKRRHPRPPPLPHGLQGWLRPPRRLGQGTLPRPWSSSSSSSSRAVLPLPVVVAAAKVVRRIRQRAALPTRRPWEQQQPPQRLRRRRRRRRRRRYLDFQCRSPKLE